MSKRMGERREDSVVVAVDKDKGSQYALKWTVDNVLSRGHPLTLLHVKQTHFSGHSDANIEETAKKSKQSNEALAKEMFLPFRCFCSRKDIKCNEVILEESDVSRAIMDYVSAYSVETLVLGAPNRSGLLRRFKSGDVASTVSKGSPDFCTVYVIAKGKITSVRAATCQPPRKLTGPNQAQHSKTNSFQEPSDLSPINRLKEAERSHLTHPRIMHEEIEIRSPFNRGYESSLTGSDISSVSSGRPSTERSHTYLYDIPEAVMGSTLSTSSASEYDNRSYTSSLNSKKLSIDFATPQSEFYSSASHDSERISMSGMSEHYVDDIEAEMRRLKLELKQTMDMYSNACKEAMTAQQKAMELQRWKAEEQKRMEEARLSEGGALTFSEKERVKSKASLESTVTTKTIAELETQKRILAETKAIMETGDSNHTLSQNLRYRRYSIEEIEKATNNFSDSLKIGEGGYGPVYKGTLDHTPVAIKVLRPDAAQGRSQFQQEVEVLCCIRHPNMVLLLGACPEYGCLVYEHMAKGSLEDCLFRKGNMPVLSWQIRFRIAAEIATGLLFLHQTKPEPLVHRDLKPGNILLDRNYVSKISDVGLARLVPPTVADSVTQYLMTSTAGTFCYIDPEYQQTGMLGTKSDVYSLGIMLLQIITGKPPMGLISHVEQAIEKGTLANILDPDVPDWPLEYALMFAKIAIQCAELRKRDRPDLGTGVLPVLNKLRDLAEECTYAISAGPSPSHSQVSISSIPDMISDPHLRQFGYDSSRSRSSTSSQGGKI